MISVAMATYNGERYIERQLKSVLANLAENDEVVISDDGSTDKTIEIIKKLKDSRVRIVDGPKAGVVKNFENAVRQCKGKYIFFCDQDDFWYNGKVDKVLRCFKNEKCLLVEHDARVVDDREKVIYPSFFAYRRVRDGVIKNAMRNTYHGCLIAFDARIKKYILPFPTSGCLHDQWTGIMADALGKTVFLNEVLMDYVRHGCNYSSFEHLPLKKQFLDRSTLFLRLFCRLILHRTTKKNI